MTGDRMDFEVMVPNALRALMTSALGQVARHGLAGDHHFYISYDTGHDGVVMPESLRAEYPETITIVLQHEFWDLALTDEGFSVSLAFHGVPHQLTVPFAAVTGFADPSVAFGIQFKALQAGGEAAPARESPTGPLAKAKPQAEFDGRERKPGDVITLDTFRKK